MASSLRDALAKAHIVQSSLPAQTTRELPARVEAHAGLPVMRGATSEMSIEIGSAWEGSPEVAQWCAVLTEVIQTQQLIELLETAVFEGTGAARSNAEARIEAAINSLTKRKADDLRQRMGRGGWRNKGVPSWIADASNVLDCLRLGGHTAWLEKRRALAEAAKGVQVPQLLPGETSDAYDTRLSAWEDDQVVAHLEMIGYDRRKLVDAVREAEAAAERARREAEERAEADRIAALAAPIIAQFNKSTSAEALAAVTAAYAELEARQEDTYYVKKRVCEAAAQTRWPWTMRARLDLGGWRPEVPGAEVPLTAEDAAGLSDSYLVRAVEASFPALVKEAQRRWRHAPGEVYVLVGDVDYPIRVIKDGLRLDSLAIRRAPPQSGAVSLTPNPKGWWSASGYNGPDVWTALQTLQTAPKGNLFVGGVVGFYSRHPQKDYGRFIWSVSAGSMRDGFELPLDAALAVRMDMIAKVHLADPALVPSDALWLPARVASTQAGRPALRMDTTQRGAKASALIQIGARAMSQGRHGWSGSTSGAAVQAGNSANVVLASLHATSRGGGLASACSILILVEGEAPVQTGDGSGLVYEAGGSVKRVPIRAEVV